MPGATHRAVREWPGLAVEKDGTVNKLSARNALLCVLLCAAPLAARKPEQWFKCRIVNYEETSRLSRSFMQSRARDKPVFRWVIQYGLVDGRTVTATLEKLKDTIFDTTPLVTAGTEGAFMFDGKRDIIIRDDQGKKHRAKIVSRRIDAP